MALQLIKGENKPKVDEDLVAMLERALEEARSGVMEAAVVVSVCGDESFYDYLMAEDDHIQRALIVYGLDDLKYTLISDGKACEED